MSQDTTPIPDAPARSPGAASDDGWFHPTPPRDRADPDPETADAQVAPNVLTVDATPEAARRSPAQTLVHVAATALRNWPLCIVLAAFALAATIVPTLTPIATTDDWGYTRSVEILLDEGRLTVFPVVAATAVGQVLWGALFGLTFGMTLGVMRLSTVVMVALGGIALFALLRMLGVTKSRSALATGVWLFNPLTFALSFSFMTDPHFSAVMLISLAFYVRGLRPDREHLGYVLAGAFFAGFAFLIRQQGALIPLGVGLYLLVGGRLWFSWRAVRRAAAVAVIPAVMLVGYYAWLRWFNDVPQVQEAFLADLQEDGWDATFLLARRVPIYVVFYAGLLLLPILLSAFIRLRRGEPVTLAGHPLGFLAFLGWAALVTGGLFAAGLRGQHMPFAPQFVGLGGFGPPDVLGSRQRLVERGADIPVALTVAAAVGAIVLGIVLCRRLFSPRDPERAGAGLVAMVGVWQLVGILPPSYHYLNRGVTLDRYLLPAIAILLILTLWALRDVPLFQPVGWLLLAGVAVFSTAAARDYMVFMGAIWDMGHYANDNGVPNDRLDAGSGWGGYHLYTIMIEEDITRARSPSGSPWWVYFYAKPTDSSFIVATRPDVRAGYSVVEQREYDQWLEDDPVHVYLLKRWWMPFPFSEPASQMPARPDNATGLTIWRNAGLATTPAPEAVPTPGATLAAPAPT